MQPFSLRLGDEVKIDLMLRGLDLPSICYVHTENACDGLSD